MKKIVEFLRKCKKGITTAAFAVVGAVSAFAEDAASSLTEADLLPAKNALDAAKTALTDFVTHNAPTVASILGAFLVITLIFVVYGWVRRASHGR